MFMKIDLTDMLYALSFALDAVEHEVTGVRSEHGKRVAWMCMRMAKEAGISERELVDLMGCAILHDNAFSEYLRARNDLAKQGTDQKGVMEGLGAHCIIGERNLALIPFRTDVKNVLLHHHECWDGSGPFGIKGSAINPKASLIHIADMTDMHFDLTHVDQTEYEEIRSFIQNNAGVLFNPAQTQLFERALPYEAFVSMNRKGVRKSLDEEVPTRFEEYTDAEVHRLARFFTGIVDYKSSFTKDHSIGVADKAEIMARYYGWSQEKVIRYYFAGAMHDIGKLLVNNDILEKPARLTDQEYGVMQDHAAWTLKILSGIKGMEDITGWAANHHEKLDGSGYSRGLSEKDLTFEDKLMACIDIYQALTEERPYKHGLSHARTISIMRSMVKDHKIDGDITEEMDRVFGNGKQSTEVSEPETNVRRWKCKVCGYISEGDEPPAECPVCHADQSAFVQIFPNK
jgi:HD-GYP domain-containing protein (c-di-GMP phosphodiesterase class II)